MRELFIGWLFAINMIALMLFGIDKRRSIRKAWRIPERTLFLSAWMGGALGALIGMHIFHHKTKHNRFRYGMPSILLIWIGIVGYWIVLGGLS